MVITILLLTIQSVNGTMKLSNGFLRVLNSICRRLGIKTDGWWNSSAHIRRIGHVIEYAALGITANVAFRKWWKGLIFCIAISLLDQFTKAFVPVRHFDVKDIPFDFAGIVLGMVAVMIVRGIVKVIRTVRKNGQA